MLRKLIYILTVFLFIIVTPVFAADFKISDVKTDFSNNMLLLNGNTKSAYLNYTAGFSETPLRAYIDLDNTILVENKKTVELNNPHIKKVVMAQFSAKPNKVRIVFYSDSLNALKNIKLIKNGNSLVFKLSSFKYEDDRFPVIFSDVLPKQYKMSKINNVEALKFSEYIMTSVYDVKSGLLVSGIGNVRLSRPFILTNPIRIVFDMQNAIAQSKDLYQEYKLANGDTVKIGQYNANTMRFVVTTNNPVNYKSFIAPDLHSLFITNIAEPQVGALTNTNVPAAIKKVSLKQINANETDVAIEFNAPVIHSLRRTYNKFLIDFLNVDFAKNEALVRTQKTAQFGGFSAQKMSENSTHLSLLFPVSNTLKVETLASQDSKAVIIKLTGTLEEPQKQEPAKAVKPKNLPLKNKVIVVDAGHGGKDAGAISGKMYEKEAALKISKLLQKNLEDKGAKVIMTRSNDTFVTLQDRVSISNYENADLFISIHLNSSEKTNIHGIETHWYKTNSQILAKCVQDEMMKNIKANNRGLFKSMFYVINHTTAPAILVETGFISNSGERNELFQAKRQQMTADAISEGIINYYKVRK